MTSNQAFQSRGQKRRRSTTWRGVRCGVQHFPEKFPIHLERCRISLKKQSLGFNKYYYIWMLSKSKFEEKVCESNPDVFRLFTWFFTFLICFSMFHFQTFFFCDIFPGRFFLALSHELRVAFQGNLGPYSFAGYLRCVKRSWIHWRSFSSDVIDMTLENIKVCR